MPAPLKSFSATVALVLASLPFTARAEKTCAEIDHLKSPPGGAALTLSFWNTSQKPVNVAWIDFSGHPRLPYFTMAPGELYAQQTYQGHLFLVDDGSHQCLGVVEARPDRKDVVIDDHGLVDPTAAAAIVDELRHEREAAYQVETVSGFQVHVHRQVLAHPVEATAALTLLRQKLDECRQLMKARWDTLSPLSIWVEWEIPGTRAARYNPGQRALEITDTRKFLTWTQGDQPMMVLHELTHAVSDLSLRKDDQGLRAAYGAASKSRRYEAVDQADGKHRRAYAMNNQEEYFAELSEAYFGYNDWYPHTRWQLEQLDPQGYALMERVWGPPPQDRVLAFESCKGAEDKRSQPHGERTIVRFENTTRDPVDLIWIDFDGAHLPRQRLKPGESVDELTWAGHVFMVSAANGRCAALFTAEPKPHRTKL